MRFGSFLFALLLTSTVLAETVKLTSLEWPPYSGADLPEQGASIAVAKAAFNAMGHELQVDFFPWTRAVKLAEKQGSGYMGYFPEYYYESDTFSFSDPIGKGPLGLVEAKGNPITWSKINDLTKYTVGVVQDYVNTEELDKRIAAGDIDAQAVTSDDKNLRKLVAGRIDTAVIDANVFNYLVNNDQQLSSLADKLQMNARLLTEKKLFVAFKNTDEGNRWREIFNQGLQKIDVESIMNEHMQ
ncbi:hypothetical protein HMF8227_02635 [Saliniradius amylolyticus]|uniref:Uncharacterized protein n=1 Tax=Saliniradius amylolyticus TaxID=2183582 RepID=A0A2S2E814_9ALTE|nr:transporter substrate-binding domain-containing protein [Saliniradius amylolyticus]AWL13087.1 hypothetical protein HMF8227_02635 [Saliniradius amylolyticus]